MIGWLPRLIARAPVTVYTKLIWAFLAIVTLLVGFGGIGLVVLNQSNQRNRDFIELQRKIAAYKQLQYDTTNQLYSITTVLLNPHEQMLASTLRHLHLYRYDLDRVEFVSRDEVELFGKIQQEHEELTNILTRVVELTREGHLQEAMALRQKQVKPVSDRLERLINEMVNRAEADIITKNNQSIRSLAVSQWLYISFGLASVGLALLLGYAISRSLVGPIMKIDALLAKISAGDFTQRLTVPNRDELGGLAENLNSMSEELRNLYQQIEMASHHKSEFLANVSHELRTPLNAIIGYSEMLIEDAEDKEQEEFIPDLKKIHTSGKHLLTIISDILDLSKIEAGKIELIPETFRIEDMIHDVAVVTETLARKHENILTINCDANLGNMHADPTRIRQILFNILSNACKFTEKGSIIFNVIKCNSSKPGWLKIEVKDTGIGMTAEQMKKLFQPFSQGKQRIGDKHDGTGLGLVITKQFCELMGGEIKVESVYGSGTAVTILLPLNIRHTGSVEMPSFHIPTQRS